MSENNGNGNHVFPLDEALAAYLAEGQKELEALQRRARDLEAHMNGALGYFALFHGLKGQWKLAPNGRELVQTEETINAL